MYTIYDYLKYYGNYDVREIPWNIMDNLLCAILVYIPLKNFSNIKSFSSFCEEAINLNGTNSDGVIAKESQDLFKIVKKLNRYKNMRVKNFINIVDDKTQFGACTFLINNIKIVSFKGSDKSLIGWQENFRLAYSYPTYTQKLAINYLDNNINIFDTEVYVIGHSKGGNLAMASSMELNKKRFKKIKKVINFDGPGFRYKEFNSEKYQILSKKLINILPTSSYVGVLLYNDNYQIITSSSHAINVHYPTSWNSFGSVFVSGKETKLSKELHERSTNNFRELDERIIKDIFESAFKSLEKRNNSNVRLSFTDVYNLLKTIKDMDSETSKYIYTILSTMLKLSKKDKTR